MSSIKNAIKNARNYALKRTDIEVLVRDATSNEKWGPSGTQMSQIAQATFSHADFTLVMNTLWERINDHGKNWRHIYKALLVVEYLLRCGSDRVISECRSKMIEIKTLMEFQKIDDHDKDVGYSIRERAKHVIELMHDDKRLQEERDKAAKNKDKYGVAVSNVAGGPGPSYGSTSSAAYNNSSSGSYGGTTRKPMTSMGYTPGQGTYGSAMRENRDRDSYSGGNSLEPRGSFRSTSQSTTRSTNTRESTTRDQPNRTSTQPTTRARAPSISDDEYSISDDESPRPVTSQPRRASNSTPSTNTAQSVDDFFAPRGGSFVSAPSTTQHTGAVQNNADPLWALLAGPTAPSTHTAPTPLTAPSTGYTPFSFPPAPSSSVTAPSNHSAMLFPSTAAPSVPATTHSFQALSLNAVGTGNTSNNGAFFPSPRNNEDDWNDFAKAGMSSSTPSNNSLSNQLGVKSDLIDLDSLTSNKRAEVKVGTAPAYRPIVASSTTPSTGMTANTGMMMNQGLMNNQGMMGNQGMMNNQGMMGNQGMMNNQGMMGNQGMMNNQGMMGYNTMGNAGMMNNNAMLLNPGMNYNSGMMGNTMMTPNTSGGMMGNAASGGMMTPNNQGMYNGGMLMMPGNSTGMTMNSYPNMNAGMAVNHSASNTFKF